MRAAAAYFRSRDRLQQTSRVSRPTGHSTGSLSAPPSSPPRPHEPAVVGVGAEDVEAQDSSSDGVAVRHKRGFTRKRSGSSSKGGWSSAKGEGSSSKAGVSSYKGDGSSFKGDGSSFKGDGSSFKGDGPSCKRVAEEGGRSSSSSGGSDEKRRKCGDTGRSVKEMRNARFSRHGGRQLEDASTSNDSLSRIATITLTDDDGEVDIFPKARATRRCNSVFGYDATENGGSTRTTSVKKSRPRLKSVGRKCRRELRRETDNLYKCAVATAKENVNQGLQPAHENSQNTAHGAGLVAQGSACSRSSAQRSLYDVALCARKLYDTSVICRTVAERFSPGNPRLEAFLRLKLKEEEPSWSVESRGLEEGGPGLVEQDGCNGWSLSRMGPVGRDTSTEATLSDKDVNNNSIRRDGTKGKLKDPSYSLMPIELGNGSKETIEVEHMEQLQLESPVNHLGGEEAARGTVQPSLAGEWRCSSKPDEGSGGRCHNEQSSRRSSLSTHCNAGNPTVEVEKRRPVLQVLPYNVLVEEQGSDDCPSPSVDHLRQAVQRLQTLARTATAAAFELPRALLPPAVATAHRRLNSMDTSVKCNGHCPDCNVGHGTSASSLKSACKKSRMIGAGERCHATQTDQNTVASGEEAIFEEKASVAIQHDQRSVKCNKHQTVGSKAAPAFEGKNPNLLHTSTVTAKDGSASASGQAEDAKLASRGGRKTRERRCKRRPGQHQQEVGLCSSTRACLRQLLPAAEPLKRVKRRQSRRIVPDKEEDTVTVTRDDTECFLSLIERDVIIAEFLRRDVCRLYADCFLLAVVFVYFMRAGLRHQHYDRLHFFGALYLAHDLEEDDENMKRELLLWLVTDESLRELLQTASADPTTQHPSGAASQARAPADGQPGIPSESSGRHSRRCCSSRHRRYNMRWLRRVVLITRDKLFWAMNCRAIVSRTSCLKVMSFHPDHSAWQRERPDYHADIVRECRRGSVRRGRLYKRPSEDMPSGCSLCLERQQASCLNSSTHLTEAGPCAPKLSHVKESVKLMEVERQSVLSQGGRAVNCGGGCGVAGEQRTADTVADVVMADTSNDEYHDTSGVSCPNTSSGKEGKDSGYESVLVYSADSGGGRAARPHLYTAGPDANSDSGALASGEVAVSGLEPWVVTASPGCNAPCSPYPACCVAPSRGRRCRRSSARRERRVTAANIRDSLFIRPRNLLPLLDQLYHREKSGCMDADGAMERRTGGMHDAALKDMEDYYTRGREFPWQFAKKETNREICVGGNVADENVTTNLRVHLARSATLEAKIVEFDDASDDVFADASDDAVGLIKVFTTDYKNNIKLTETRAVQSQASDSTDEHWSQAETVILAGSGQ